MKKDYPIKLGTFLFTMVEPTQGPRGGLQPLVRARPLLRGMHDRRVQFAGDRFVATKAPEGPALPRRDRDDARPDDRLVPGDLLGAQGPPRRVEPVERQQVNWLHANGRMFAERDHVHTLLYDHDWALQRTDGHHHRARARPRIPGAGRHCRRTGRRQDPRRRPGVEEPWAQEAFGRVVGSRPHRQRHPAAAARRPPRRRGPASPTPTGASCRCTSSTTTRPRAGPRATPRIGDALNASGLATHVWTSPFINTVFGTDIYTDQLCVSAGPRGTNDMADLPDLKGKRILVTGVTGMVAAPVAKALAADNTVFGAARLKDPAAREALEAQGVTPDADGPDEGRLLQRPRRSRPRPALRRDPHRQLREGPGGQRRRRRRPDGADEGRRVVLPLLVDRGLRVRRPRAAHRGLARSATATARWACRRTRSRRSRRR